MSFENAMRELNLTSVDYDLDIARRHFDLKQLCGLKASIETSLESLFDRLKKELGADMDTRLVTEDGFPRGDIDVVQVRLVRVQIIRLRNDLKEVLHLIEGKMAQQFSEMSAGGTNGVIGEPRQTDLALLIAFATVTEVSESSPASAAGLLVGDKVLRFGRVNVTNHDNLRSLAPIVQNNVGKPVSIAVLRNNGSREELELTPRSWSGRGLLGCKLVEIK